MKWTILVVSSVAIACNSITQKPPQASASSIGSSKADFSKYQTFTFGPANPPASGYATTARSLEVQRRLAALVEKSLEGRGYRPSADRADLVIKVSTGSGSIPGEQDKPKASADKPAGFIGIDAYDSATGVSIWHGSAFAEIDPEQIDDRLLAVGVEKMLADFPTRRD